MTAMAFALVWQTPAAHTFGQLQDQAQQAHDNRNRKGKSTKAEGRVPLLVRQMLGDDYFDEVVSVNLNEPAVNLPSLFTIQSGISQIRYASLKGIMAAKKKEIRDVTPVIGAFASASIAARRPFNSR